MSETEGNINMVVYFELGADGAFDFSDEFLALLDKLKVEWVQSEMAYKMPESGAAELAEYCEKINVDFDVLPV